jgi:hypothetical protein
MEITEFQKNLRRDMIAVAKSPRGVIFYSDLGRHHGIEGDDEYNFNKLANEIGTVSEYEHEHGRPLLSVVVVRKDTVEPGLGFFKLAKALGIMKFTWKSETNRLKFYAEEHRRVTQYWRSSKS